MCSSWVPFNDFLVKKITVWHQNRACRVTQIMERALPPVLFQCDFFILLIVDFNEGSSIFLGKICWKWCVNTGACFLAELLLWYLTGNILGIEVSCGRHADDVQMTCGEHADDLQMTREWDFGWDFTGRSSGMSSRHLPELPNFMQYYTWCHPHVIRSQRN